MKTLSESAVRRHAKYKGLLLQKGRSHPPYLKPFRIVDGITGEIRFGYEWYGHSLAECADFLNYVLPSSENIKARLRRLDARVKADAGRAAFEIRKRGIKNVRARKIWKGVKFAPVSESTLFNFEIEGTSMPIAPLHDIFTLSTHEHR